MNQILKLLALVTIVLSLSSCGYNSMVDYEEEVSGQWAQVENVYQRRADMIPNLQAIVEGVADFERGTLNDVVNARSKATSIQLSGDDLTPEKIKMFEKAQSGLTTAMSRLLLQFERYPELKATAAFRDFMTQYEGTENRITTARRDFNDAVKEYNSYVRKIPNNITAGIFGFQKKGYFEADTGAEKAPVIDFTGKRGGGQRTTDGGGQPGGAN